VRRFALAPRDGSLAASRWCASEAPRRRCYNHRDDLVVEVSQIAGLRVARALLDRGGARAELQAHAHAFV
jgi:hypothetical protein